MKRSFAHVLAKAYNNETRRRLEAELQLALFTTPAYCTWQKRDPGEGSDIFNRLAALPALSKSDLRFHGPQGFIPAGRDLAQGLASGEIELVSTSGTTSDQVTNAWYQPWWDSSEAESWQLNRFARQAATGDHREAILTSPLCSGVPCEEALLPQTQRRIGRFLFLSERSDPRTWDDDLMERMVTELNAYQPVLLEANPSFLTILARYILRTGKQVYRPQLITFTYEVPSLLHYRLCARAFGAPLASSYGTTETGYVFMECDYGCLHQVTNNVHVDWLPLHPQHGGPSVGQMLVTTIGNPWRALLRFDVGDLARLAGSQCPCGRTEGLTLASIEGRVINLTFTPDGRAVTLGEVDRAVAEVSGLVEYQLVQTGSAEYALSAVIEGARPEEARGTLAEALQRVYGPTAVVHITLVKAIAPDPPGKYKLVKSVLSAQSNTLLDSEFAPLPLEA